MAKGNFLMNTVAGKLGSMVLYRAKGDQRSRTYVKTVSNPKTRAQLDQRTQLANLVAVYRAMKNVMSSAFENAAANQSQYNAFVSANLNVGTSVHLSKADAAAGACIAAPYQVTKGSLPPVTLTGLAPDAITNISVGVLTSMAGVTVAELSAALVASNAGISYGMQLSYYSLMQGRSIVTGAVSCGLTPYEMTLDSEDGSLVSHRFPARALGITDGSLSHVADTLLGGYCWVWSRKDSGSIKVSSQSLNITSTDTLAQYTGSSAATRGASSYGIGASVFLSPTTRGDVVPVVHNPSVLSFKTSAGVDVRKSETGFLQTTAMNLNGALVTGNNLSGVIAVKVFTATSGHEQTNAAVIAGAVAVTATNQTDIGMTLSSAVAASVFTRIAIVMDGIIVWNAITNDPTD